MSQECISGFDQRFWLKVSQEAAGKMAAGAAGTWRPDWGWRIKYQYKIIWVEGKLM